MKLRGVFLFYLMMPIFIMAQPMGKEIDSAKGTIVLSRNMNIDDLNLLFGKYSIIRNGDTNKPQYFWNSDEKNDISVFFENGKASIVILRSSKYLYKELKIGDPKDRIMEIFGTPTSLRAEGANNTYYYESENIRIDVSNKTNLIYGIFIYL